MLAILSRRKMQSLLQDYFKDDIITKTSVSAESTHAKALKFQIHDLQFATSTEKLDPISPTLKIGFQFHGQCANARQNERLETTLTIDAMTTASHLILAIAKP